MIILALMVQAQRKRESQYVLVDRDYSFRVISMKRAGLQKIAVPFLDPRGGGFGQRIYFHDGAYDTQGRQIMR